MRWFERTYAAAAGVAGLAGVAFSALAAHGPGSPLLDTAARFFLVHAAALLGLTALLSAGALAARTGRAAGLALVLGMLLFCGDLISRSFAGRALFPMAAPTGGTLLMIGWGLTALAALIRPKG